MTLPKNKFETILTYAGSASDPYSEDVCPDETTLAAYIDDTLPQEEVRRLHSHMANCKYCRMTVEAASKTIHDDDVLSNISDPAASLKAEIAAMEESLSLGKLLSNIRVKPHIMVVDDDPVYLDALADTLSSEFNVTPCSDGMEAVRRISEEIRVIVLEKNIAGLDGVDLAEQLQNEFSELSIIFNTTHAGDLAPENVETRYVPFAYVTKNRPDQLIAAIRSASKSTK